MGCGYFRNLKGATMFWLKKKEVDLTISQTLALFKTNETPVEEQLPWLFAARDRALKAVRSNRLRRIAQKQQDLLDSQEYEAVIFALKDHGIKS